EPRPRVLPADLRCGADPVGDLRDVPCEHGPGQHRRSAADGALRGELMMKRRTLATTTLRLLAGAALLCATRPCHAEDQAPHGPLRPQPSPGLPENLGAAPRGPKQPQGVDAAPWTQLPPADNATTPERIELGRKLYFDLHLSKDGTVACATCHDV